MVLMIAATPPAAPAVTAPGSAPEPLSAVGSPTAPWSGPPPECGASTSLIHADGFELSSAAPVGTYTLTERYGVAHPEQVVALRLRAPPAPGVAYDVRGPNGQPVAHQWLSDGRLAVRLEGGLAAFGSRSFTVSEQAPSPPAGSNLVSVVEGPQVIEISNGLVGVRVPTLAQTPSQAPVPIQAVRLRNGTWAAVGQDRVLLSKETGNPFPVQGAQREFLERGPLRVVVRITYQVPRSGISGVVSAGTGFHRTTIRIDAGQPSLLVEHDSDVDSSFHLAFGTAFTPNEARFQGHSVTAPMHGTREDGSAYPPWHDRYNEDAVVALPLSHSSANPFGRYLPRWDPWIADNGWYWQFYRRADAAGANMVGLFAGPASVAIGAQYSGVLIDAGTAERLALRIDTERGRPPARVWPRNRFAWGLYAATRGDIRPATEPQPIARQMSLFGGITLEKIATIDCEGSLFARPSPGLYLDAGAIHAMITRLRSEAGGQPGGPYFQQLLAADPALIDLWRAWADSSGVSARNLANAIFERARTALDAMVNRFGIYDFNHHYWHGGLLMSRDAVFINGLINLADLDPAALGVEDVRRLERIATLYGTLLWDNDHTPLHDGHGLNLGTPNMPVMQASFRQTYAIWLHRHPVFGPRAAQARSEVMGLIPAVLNEHGASIGSSGYILASLVPILNVLQQLQLAGGPDPFVVEPRLARAAEYDLHLLTPREARFGGRRKTVSFGDGNTMSTELSGQLGTALRRSNVALSERSMSGWRQAGAAHSFFYGSSVLKIDDQLPGREPNLGDANFPGVLTVLRNGWNSPGETAAWLLNGTWYRDHYHCDLGALMLYALGAPLSLHFGSGYDPRMPGAWMQNVVVPESALGQPWTSTEVSTESCFGNREQQTVGASGLSQGTDWSMAYGRFEGGGLDWRRRLVSYRFASAPTVIRIRDDFGGAAAARIASFALMAQGAVDTPSGAQTPPRGSANRPSVGPTMTLASGMTRLRFQGQWGIDFDVYIDGTDTATQAYIGEWGHQSAPNRERNEFQAANGRPFEERQYILRLRASGPFDVVIVPYRSGERPSDLSVTRSGSNLQLTRNGVTTTLLLPAMP